MKQCSHIKQTRFVWTIFQRLNCLVSNCCHMRHVMLIVLLCGFSLPVLSVASAQVRISNLPNVGHMVMQRSHRVVITYRYSGIHGNVIAVNKISKQTTRLSQVKAYTPYGAVTFILQHSLAKNTASLMQKVMFSHALGYTQQWRNPYTQLMVLGGFRSYFPALKRFIVADTLTAFMNHKTHNAYTYVKGNPILFLDNSGHMPEKEGGVRRTPVFKEVDGVEASGFRKSVESAEGGMTKGAEDDHIRESVERFSTAFDEQAVASAAPTPNMSHIGSEAGSKPQTPRDGEQYNESELFNAHELKSILSRASQDDFDYRVDEMRIRDIGINSFDGEVTDLLDAVQDLAPLKGDDFDSADAKYYQVNFTFSVGDSRDQRAYAIYFKTKHPDWLGREAVRLSLPEEDTVYYRLFLPLEEEEVPAPVTPQAVTPQSGTPQAASLQGP